MCHTHLCPAVVSRGWPDSCPDIWRRCATNTATHGTTWRRMCAKHARTCGRRHTCGNEVVHAKSVCARVVGMECGRRYRPLPRLAWSVPSLRSPPHDPCQPHVGQPPQRRVTTYMREVHLPCRPNTPAHVGVVTRSVPNIAPHVAPCGAARFGPPTRNTIHANHNVCAHARATYM